MTPDRWSRDTAWKHGTPRRIVLSGELDPDPLTLPEVAGEPVPPPARQPRLLRQNWADLIVAAVIIATLTAITVLWPDFLRAAR